MSIMYTNGIAVLLWLFARTIEANYIPPTVELNSCMDVTAHFTINNMTAGGLVYTRTYRAFNILPTVDGTMEYTCPFEDCGIAFNSKFTIIIQRRVVIQSNDDVHQTFVCMNDIAPIFTISSGNSTEDDLQISFANSVDQDERGPTGVLSSGDGDDLNITRLVYKPEAQMTFYRNGVELPGGSTIQLGTALTVTIEVTNNFEDFFDIDVKSCFLSALSLIEDFCPVHEDVFGFFSRVSNGNLTADFNMFRPTTTIGNSVDIIFSCVLKVCMGTCTQGCTSDSSGRRRRRNDEEKVLEDGTEVDDGNLYVGKMFTVITEEEPEEVSEVTKQPFCLHIAVVVVLLTSLGILLLLSISSSIYFTCQFIRKNKSAYTDKKDTNVSPQFPENNSCTNKQGMGVTFEPNISFENSEETDTPEEDCARVKQGNMSPIHKFKGIDNKTFNGEDSGEQPNRAVLYTSKERRRSHPIEVPILHLQNAISKLVPSSRAASKVIVYKGVGQASPDIDGKTSIGIKVKNMRGVGKSNRIG